METHTQNMIVVYVTDAEKAEIRLSAKKKGMSRYLLDLHLENVKSNLTSQSSGRGGSACEAIFACKYFVDEMCTVEADECPRR